MENLLVQGFHGSPIQEGADHYLVQCCPCLLHDACNDCNWGDGLFSDLRISQPVGIANGFKHRAVSFWALLLFNVRNSVWNLCPKSFSCWFKQHRCSKFPVGSLEEVLPQTGRFWGTLRLCAGRCWVSWPRDQWNKVVGYDQAMQHLKSPQNWKNHFVAWISKCSSLLVRYQFGSWCVEKSVRMKSKDSKPGRYILYLVPRKGLAILAQSSSGLCPQEHLGSLLTSPSEVWRTCIRDLSTSSLSRASCCLNQNHPHSENIRYSQPPFTRWRCLSFALLWGFPLLLFD